MKTLYIILTLICIASCKTTFIHNERIFNEVSQKIESKPESYLNKEFSILLNEINEDDYEVYFHTVRHFILMSVSLEFADDISIRIFFNRNTDYNFGGGLLNNNTWDMEELKGLKLSAIKIYQNKKLVSHHCIDRHCKV